MPEPVTVKEGSGVPTAETRNMTDSLSPVVTLEMGAMAGGVPVELTVRVPVAVPRELEARKVKVKAPRAVGWKVRRPSSKR